jgi:EAL domain-containing protein (putative c-di-GMP-specific phosphodiesterase class I)
VNSYKSFVREAIIRKGLKIYCQPIVALKHHGYPVAYREALIRLETINHKIITPEDLGFHKKLALLCEVDYWVIATFFQHLKTTFDTSSYSINLCAENLTRNEFVEFLLTQASQVAATDKLRIDVLGVWATDWNKLRYSITTLQQKGFQFGLDVSVENKALPDLVAKIPWNYVEFSISLTQNLTQVEPRCSLDWVSDLAKKYQVKTVAKRVQQAAIPSLLQAGVDYIQGFEFGEPKLLTQVMG